MAGTTRHDADGIRPGTGQRGPRRAGLYGPPVGLAKPDPRVYQLLCDQLSVSPGEVVFLDDSPENVNGACELGIDALLHENTAQSIKAGRRAACQLTRIKDG